MGITKQIFMKNGTGELYENLFNFHFEWTTLTATLQENLHVFLCIQVFASLLYPHTHLHPCFARAQPSQIRPMRKLGEQNQTLYHLKSVSHKQKSGAPGSMCSPVS